MSGLAEFECRLDGEPYQPCAGPVSRGGLNNGIHTFDVRARDVAGNYDPTPARWTWQVAAPLPVAADDALTTAVGTAVDVDVLANDVEPRGGTLAVVLGSDRSERGGSVAVVGSRVRYVPPAGFVGTDRFSYRVVNGNGLESVAATVAIQVTASPTTPGQGGGPLATPAKATSLAFRPATFRAAGKGASVAARKKPKPPPVGSTVRYRLDKASRVTFTVEQVTSGRRRGKSCVAPTKALRKAKKCTRYVVKPGSFMHSGKAGANSFRFTGRLSGRKLGAGSYRLTATPATAQGRRATAVRAGFKISK
jgi:hypothetical protein